MKTTSHQTMTQTPLFSQSVCLPPLRQCPTVQYVEFICIGAAGKGQLSLCMQSVSGKYTTSTLSSEDGNFALTLALKHPLPASLQSDSLWHTAAALSKDTSRRSTRYHLLQKLELPGNKSLHFQIVLLVQQVTRNTNKEQPIHG